jgi:para-aminobenzoate synthetase component 1
MKQFCRFEIPYAADSSALFEALVDQAWAVFLDSGRPGCDQGRYDILCANPSTILVTRGANTLLRSRSGIRRSEEDPFCLLRRELENHPAPVQHDLPFVGGAIGYFSYDLGRRLERLPTIAQNPDSLPEMAVGIYQWAVIVDHRERVACLAGYCGNAIEKARLQRLAAKLSKHRSIAWRQPFRVTSRITSNMTRSEYLMAFERIKRYIRDGDCYQVNLAQRFSATVEGDPWLAYRQLRSINPAPYGAYFNLPFSQILSASPERFLRVADGAIESKPIKGTRPRSSIPEADSILVRELANSEKDRAENLMIVDLLRNDLSKCCAIGSIKAPKLFDVESFATVHHLVSTVTGQLDGNSRAVDLLRACFPGGSITGAPKLRAMEIIEELEPERRGVYCGSIGYLGFDGAMDTSIAIRTLTVTRGTATVAAGGGIVADSVGKQEYQETLDKASAMLRLLSMFQADSMTGDRSCGL